MEIDLLNITMSSNNRQGNRELLPEQEKMTFLCYDWTLKPAQAGVGWRLLEQQPQLKMT